MVCELKGYVLEDYTCTIWYSCGIMAKNSIDFNALKARTLGSGHDEEAVTVNTRALIDKVLARYSGEW